MRDTRAVTTENWSTGPCNRWAFQHVQELFPTCRLARSAAEPVSLPVATQPLLQLDCTAPGRSLGSLADTLERACCDAFLVAQRGHIVAEHYFNGMSRHSHHMLFSVTKSFVGMLAGIAADRGQLDPASLVATCLPDLNTPAWRGTTVRHLLDMTAAVRYSEDYSNAQADMWKESAVVGWRPALRTGNTPRTLHDYARSLEAQDMENGAKFQYRTVCTNVLGMVLERVMQAPLAELLEREIWSPLDTEHDATVVVDPSYFPYVGAGLSATARDLLRFGLMLLNDGRLNGRQVVPTAWIADTVRASNASRDCFARSQYGAILQGWHYRNQVWVASSSPTVMLGIGIHGQMLYMDKGRDLVIVLLSSQPEPLDLGLSLDLLTAIQVIGASLGSRPQAPA